MARRSIRLLRTQPQLCKKDADLYDVRRGGGAKPTDATHAVPILSALKSEFTNAAKDLEGVIEFRNIARRDRVKNRRRPVASSLSIFVGSYENEWLMEMQKLLVASGDRPISLVFGGVYFTSHGERPLRDISP